MRINHDFRITIGLDPQLMAAVGRALDLLESAMTDDEAVAALEKTASRLHEMGRDPPVIITTSP